jgi:hypothetical protein
MTKRCKTRQLLDSDMFMDEGDQAAREQLKIIYILPVSH